MRSVVLVVCAAVLGVSGFALAGGVQPHKSGARVMPRRLVLRALRGAAVVRAARSSTAQPVRVPQIVRRQSAGSQTFVDATGDSSTAPDITNVAISNDDAGLITMAISLPNRSALQGNDIVIVLLDTDQNPSTGSGGFDDIFAIGSGAALLGVWNGSTFVPTAAGSFSGAFANAQATFRINRSDLGNATVLNFGIGSSGDGGNTLGDIAPENGIWTYPIVIGGGTTTTSTGSTDTTTTTSTTTTTTTTTTPPPPPPPLTLSVAKVAVNSPKAGGQLIALMIVFRDDTGDPLTSGTLACAARVGTKALRISAKVGPKGGLAVCTWKLAKTLKGKRVTGSIKVTFQGVSVSRPFAKKIR